MPHTSDTRVQAYDPLLAPAALLDELPLDDGLAKNVEQARVDICSVLDHVDDRLLVVVGPCSVHDRARLSQAYAGQPLLGHRVRVAAAHLGNQLRQDGRGQLGRHRVEHCLERVRHLL